MFKKLKSYLVAVLAILTILTLQSFTFAGETISNGLDSEPIDHDISINDGEFKIISFDGTV